MFSAANAFLGPQQQIYFNVAEFLFRKKLMLLHDTRLHATIYVRQYLEIEVLATDSEAYSTALKSRLSIPTLLYIPISEERLRGTGIAVFHGMSENMPSCLRPAFSALSSRIYFPAGWYYGFYLRACCALFKESALEDASQCDMWETMIDTRPYTQ